MPGNPGNSSSVWSRHETALALTLGGKSPESFQLAQNRNHRIVHRKSDRFRCLRAWPANLCKPSDISWTRPRPRRLPGFLSTSVVITLDRRKRSGIAKPAAFLRLMPRASTKPFRTTRNGIRHQIEPKRFEIARAARYCSAVQRRSSMMALDS